MYILNDREDCLIDTNGGFAFEIEHVQLDEFWIVFVGRYSRRYIMNITTELNEARKNLHQLCKVLNYIENNRGKIYRKKTIFKIGENYVDEGNRRDDDI